MSTLSVKQTQYTEVSSSHLMFRDGLLSPRSKLLPQDAKPALYPFGKGPDARARSVMSIASTSVFRSQLLDLS